MPNGPNTCFSSAVARSVLAAGGHDPAEQRSASAVAPGQEIAHRDAASHSGTRATTCRSSRRAVDRRGRRASGAVAPTSASVTPPDRERGRVGHARTTNTGAPVPTCTPDHHAGRAISAHPGVEHGAQVAVVHGRDLDDAGLRRRAASVPRRVPAAARRADDHEQERRRGRRSDACRSHARVSTRARRATR